MQVTLSTIRTRAPGRSDTPVRRVWVWEDGVVEVEPEGDATALEVVRDLDWPGLPGADDLPARMRALDGRSIGYSTIFTSTLDLPPDEREPLMDTATEQRDSAAEARLRQVTAQVRAVPDAGDGVVEARVTTFDNDYPVGFGVRERIAPGAFADSIAEQESLPIFYEHAWAAGPIGNTTSAREDDDGLTIRGQLYVDGPDPDPRARSVWRAMKAGALREWSIGFFPETITPEEREDVTVEVITRGRLAEASVVVRGANPETQTLAIRSLSREQQQALREALDAIGFSTDDDARRVVEQADAGWLDEVDPEVIARALEVGPLREFLREQVAGSTPPAR